MKKISLLEYASTFFMVIISPFLGMGLYNLLISANIDSSISVILGYILSFSFLVIFFKINNYKPNLNLKDKINTLFNKKISIIIISILCLSLFLMAAALSYNLNSFVISQFLSETPIIFIAIIIGILVIYINNKGIEVILRVSNLLFFFNIILLIVALLGNYNRIDLTNMLPLLSVGIKRPIIGSISIIIFQLIYIFILLIIPKDSIKNNKHFNKVIVIALSCAFLLFLLIIIYTIGSLGIDLTLKYHYPAYIVLKEISIFGFIDKIENFIIIHWIFEVFITLSLITYFINKMTNIKPYILVITNILFYTIIFKNSTLYNYIVSIYVPYLSITILTIMLIIYFKIKKTG